jgi:hypothetical protein
VIHRVKSSPAIEAAPAVAVPRVPPTPSQTVPGQPSKAQQIGDANAAYVNADLIDEYDDPALLERRISAILGTESDPRESEGISLLLRIYLVGQLNPENQQALRRLRCELPDRFNVDFVPRNKIDVLCPT